MEADMVRNKYDLIHEMLRKEKVYYTKQQSQLEEEITLKNKELGIFSTILTFYGLILLFNRNPRKGLQRGCRIPRCVAGRVQELGTKVLCYTERKNKWNWLGQERTEGEAGALRRVRFIPDEVGRLPRPHLLHLRPLLGLWEGGHYSITRVTYSNFKTLPEAEQGVTLSLSFSCVWYLSLLSVCSVEQRQLLPHSVWLHWSVWTNEESCRSQPSPGRHWEVQDAGGNHGGPGVSKRQGQRGGQEAFNLERGAPGELGKS